MRAWTAYAASWCGVACLVVGTLCLPACKRDPAATLIVHVSDPPAALFVDAIARGDSQELYEITLDPGEHVVELRRGDTILAMETVHIGAGQRREITMASGAIRARGSEEMAPPPPVEPPEPSATGRVRVLSDPPGQLFVDDIPHGATPLEVDLGAGTAHVLRVEAPAHAAARTTLTLGAGESREVSLILSPAP